MNCFGKKVTFLKLSICVCDSLKKPSMCGNITKTVERRYLRLKPILTRSHFVVL